VSGLQVKLIGLLLMVLSLTGVGLWGQHERLVAVKAKAEVTALQTRNDGLQRALDSEAKEGVRKDAINLAKQRTINQLTADAAKNQQKLNEALKANRAWADAPVPDSVWDAIGSPAPSGEAKDGIGVDGTRPGPDAKRK
jgi:hypothetical protein